MYCSKLIARKEALCKQIQLLQKELERLPKGELRCRKNGGYTKWYQYRNGEEAYIPKKQRNLAEQLAVRKYKEALLNEMQNERNAIEQYLRYQDKCKAKANDLLEESSMYRELLLPYYDSNNSDIDNWAFQNYEKNLSHPEHLIHKTIAGYNVRSKSESLIVSALYTNQIPFRYECALHLGEITLFPDFTILHPYTKKIYYYEHFGMMDNSEYAQSAYKKLQLYAEHNIIPSINLITTFETRDNPLDTEMLEKIIQFYFKH